MSPVPRVDDEQTEILGVLVEVNERKVMLVRQIFLVFQKYTERFL